MLAVIALAIISTCIVNEGKANTSGSPAARVVVMTTTSTAAVENLLRWCRPSAPNWPSAPGSRAGVQHGVTGSFTLAMPLRVCDRDLSVPASGRNSASNSAASRWR